jgi:N-acetyl-gamma-glutamyl-phosphate reductase
MTDSRQDEHRDRPAVFIDGEAGTVGLSIRQRLAGVPDLRVISIRPDLRKEVDARLECYRQADVALLCLPDPAAPEIVARAAELGDAAPKILDASTAHRVDSGWVYGFPELDPHQPAAIARAVNVTNPGCYATGAIALLRPLVEAGVVPSDYPVTVNAVSGYTGGGKSLIEDFESGKAPVFKLYALELGHKHLGEIQAYSRLARPPIFVPSVGSYRQGMLISIPLHLDTLPGKPSSRDLGDVLSARYATTERIRFIPPTDLESRSELEPEALNDTDALELRIFAREDHRHAPAVPFGIASQRQLTRKERS